MSLKDVFSASLAKRTKRGRGWRPSGEYRGKPENAKGVHVSGEYEKTPNQIILGDPAPGQSALDKKLMEKAHEG